MGFSLSIGTPPMMILAQIKRRPRLDRRGAAVALLFQFMRAE